MEDFIYLKDKKILKNICGIYCIQNIKNKKCYVGSSKNLYYRLSKHKYLLKKDIHYNKHLQSAFNLYKITSFEVDILEFCKEDEMAKKETYWINNKNSKEQGYNQSFVSEFGGNVVTDETKLKISKTLLKNKCVKMIDKISKKEIKRFKSLFEAAEYIIENQLSQAKADRIRMKISESAKNKLISTGKNRKARRQSAYGYIWRIK